MSPSPFYNEKNWVRDKTSPNSMYLRLITLASLSFMAAWIPGSLYPGWSRFQVFNVYINHNFTLSLVCLLYSTGHHQKNKVDPSFHSHQSENCVGNMPSTITSMSRPDSVLVTVLHFFPAVLIVHLDHPSPLKISLVCGPLGLSIPIL